MRMVAALGACLLVVTSCASGPSTTTPTATAAATPIGVGLAEDGAFRLSIHAASGTQKASEAIDVLATLTYIGGAQTMTAVGSGSGLVGFSLRQLDGHLTMGWAHTNDCHTYPMERGVVVPMAFVKSAGFIGEDPDAAFWRAYLADPVMHLPVGTWQIDAVLDSTLSVCGGERHQLTASVVIVLEP
jgi:hypothetical protein